MDKRKTVMKIGRKLTAALMIMLLASAGLLASCGINKEKEITSLEQLDRHGRKIGIATDTNEYQIVADTFPKATPEYMKDDISGYLAVSQGKIDAFVGNRLAMVMAVKNGQTGVRILDDSIGNGNVGAVAISPRTKIPGLTEKINEFLDEIKADGTLDDMRKRWTEDLVMEMPDIPKAKDPKIHLIVGTTGLSAPFTCYVDDKLAGYDIELAKRFAAWLGASIEFKIYDYEGIVAAAQGGDVDCIFANLYVTPEREQVIEFSEPTYVVDIGVLVHDKGARNGGLLSSLKEGFEKTFVREGRWKLFVQGIGTTLLITVLSIILGTLLGFAVFMACRKGKRFANGVTRFCIWLIEGMPVVVFLMILYYIVFARARLSGVTVSVIAFTLIFSAAVYSMLVTGVSAVGTGQLEAAYSLGYRDRKAFYRIILPQALPYIMPSYKKQITALIKATAVVGYVAVQDLTKMGDIVRSRTYEAFFPLIAVAVFYFILAGILTWIVNKIEIRTVPGSRRDRDMKAE